jgi:hypothetical protein
MIVGCSAVLNILKMGESITVIYGGSIGEGRLYWIALGINGEMGTGARRGVCTCSNPPPPHPHTHTNSNPTPQQRL